MTADVARGRITALIGLNGSGKTTLLRALVGELPYRGADPVPLRPRPHAAAAASTSATSRSGCSIDARLPLTVRDLLGLALKRAAAVPRLRPGDRPPDASACSTRSDAEELLDRPVDGLSGGQLQRVLLALALDPQPELLLLDEPAAGIDFKEQQTFYELIADLNRETGVTILLVSHDLTMVGRIADHVLCLKDGVIHRQGPPQQVITPETWPRSSAPRLGPVRPPSRPLTPCPRVSVRVQSPRLTQTHPVPEVRDDRPPRTLCLHVPDAPPRRPAPLRPARRGVRQGAGRRRSTSESTPRSTDLVALYKHLHANPELSLQEEQTAARMAEELKKLGFEVTTKVGGHGVVGVLKNGTGPTVLVRTDMDALPVTEQTGLPYASKVRVRDTDRQRGRRDARLRPRHPHDLLGRHGPRAGRR